MPGTMMSLFVRIFHQYRVVLLITPRLGNTILHSNISSTGQSYRDERLSVDVEYRSTLG
jgi:DNA-binding transcriptional regulator PaaX